MWTTIKMFWSSRISLSVGFVFFTVSLLFGSWIARIPEVKQSLHMNEAQLGLVLLGLPIGSLLGAFFTGWQLRRQPLGRFTFLMVLSMCVVIITPGLASTPFLLGLALVAVGFTSSATDVGMNAAAAQVEKKLDITIMSACHGMFSLGGMIGALIGGIAASLEITLWIHLVLLGLLMMVLNIAIYPTLSKVPDQENYEQGFKLPPAAVLGLALIGFCIMLGEGAVADWSAIYLREVRHSSAFNAAMGFAAFSLFMALGRFAGDGFTVRYGHNTLIIGGGLIGSIGLLLAIIFPSVEMGILGFALTGLGYSVVVPLLFSQAARYHPDAPGDSIAGVATSGIIGFMVGPPAIGFIAQQYSLSTGLLTAALLGFLATFIAVYLSLSRPRA